MKPSLNPKITKLPNGLRIVTVEMTEALSVSASILVGVGGRFEDYHVNGGVSHFLEHLLFKGSRKWPKVGQISAVVDAVGGYQNAYTSNDITNFYIKVPQGHHNLALDILSDMLTAAIIDPIEVDKERGVILEEMNMRIYDDPTGQAAVLLPPLLWPKNPLGEELIGTKEVIQTIPRDSIHDYYREHYTAANMVVAVAGCIKHEDIVDQVAKLLGHLPGSSRSVFEQFNGSSDNLLTASVAKETAQANLFIGSLAYPYLHADDPAAKLAAAILGRGMSSRLFIKVREQQGLAYTVMASTQNFVDTGMFEVYAGVSIENIPAAITSIVNELKLIASEPASAEELEKVKQQIRGGLLMASESNSALAERYGTQLTLLDKTVTVEESLAKFDAVTLADIQRVSAEMLAPDKLRMSIVAPDPAEAEQTFKDLVGAK